MERPVLRALIVAAVIEGLVVVLGVSLTEAKVRAFPELLVAVHAPSNALIAPIVEAIPKVIENFVLIMTLSLAGPVVVQTILIAAFFYLGVAVTTWIARRRHARA